MDAPSLPPPAPENAPPEPSFLVDRLTGVLTGPGEVFAAVRNSPVNHSNWFVPLLLACFAIVLYIVMAMSQPTVLRSFQDARDQAMQKQVAAGKITQAQADQASAVTARFMTPTLMMIFGAVGGIGASAIGLFLLAAALWLGLKIFGSELGYMKVVEVCGLALIIDVIQKVIRTWLVSWKENMLVTVSPTFFIANPDLHNKRDLLLSLLDPIDFWWLAVLSLGLSKVASLSFPKALLIVCGVWFGFRVIAIALTPAQ